MIADCCYSGKWGEMLRLSKIPRVYMQASCGKTEKCRSDSQGGIFTQAFVDRMFNHRRHYSFWISSWEAIKNPPLAVRLIRSDLSTQEDNTAFSSFRRIHGFSPTATAHGHLPIGAGIHIGPSRCWGIPHEGVKEYMNTITLDDGYFQLSRRTDVSQSGTLPR